MLAIREEELNTVNGGMAIGGLLGGSKFEIGDKVISKSEPDLGIGEVVTKEYNKGWFYGVVMSGGMLYTYEYDLEYPIM